MPDKDLARLIGRGIATIRFHRHKLRLPPCNPVWKPWTENDLALLGKFTDAKVADRTGHPVGSVKMQRCKLGIPCCDSQRRPWLPEEDTLLGKLSDREVSRRTQRTFGTVGLLAEAATAAAKSGGSGRADAH
jgi:hypothetical protein